MEGLNSDGGERLLHFNCTRGPYDENDRTSYYRSLDADFALVPRGDGRWTYRFSEAVLACSIPVVIADGLTLPFEQLVSWDSVVVRVPEAALDAMASVRDLIALLPTGEEERARRTSEVCRIRELYFASARRREQAAMHAARIVVAASASRP